MDYTVSKLAKMAGVSRRTLRFYDEIGLLSPARVSQNGYRVYGRAEVDLLQQILIYRELGVPLEKIRSIIAAPGFDRAAALREHLTALNAQKAKIESLIKNVERTIRVMEGEIDMSDEEKFEGLKKKLIEENEKKYGREVREKYGEDAVKESNRRLAGMTPGQWARQEELSHKIAGLLARAMETNDPGCREAQKACELHSEWLCMFWKPGTYSKAAHRELAQMYVEDERFRENYEKIKPGCAEFFRDAIDIYCAE
ncbi:MAG TPA: MerR family transcriptional regulator [Clostridiales bacterium]|jgi:DNA-binding transcriptional MerR regulator|nr:MerR family transcriptional regulator [Clostridiales bacterium]